MRSIQLPSIISSTKKILKLQYSLIFKNQQGTVPKGYVAIYVGEAEKKRFVVPLSYLNHPAIEDLLKRAEEEFGFYHPMGGLTIPCKAEEFIHLASQRSNS
ncbi:Auxin-responsive protein saur23 [Dionaea muscipula]